ncbi:hypothetical protein DCAR_0935315 [Daucus carota subsp. sativus]|uniref:Jacalin-type lectin domain-containing protein n=1 Tax=Daucus carota subsp. sativus TaxID=79200 RepID=A0AAF1BDJ4_DAUCS|nr:hypothetical protein DCAR_0935315 [Daucus carota subsp. sativus]
MENIQRILQLSYDELEDDTQRAIFLDILFFFLEKNIDEPIDVFKSCDFFPEAGIPILVERCLLTIDSNNRFQMHNLIQDMGRNVIREESKHARFRVLHLDHEEASQALPNTWTHLPYGVHLQKLVVLDMPFSRFETLWRIAKLPCLRHLNLEGCKYLKELPHSIGQSTALYHLKLNDCVNLKQLPKPITQSTTLSRLNMSGCENLQLLPEQLGDLKGLKWLDATIEELPDSIGLLPRIQNLIFERCKKLTYVPNSICNLKSLEYLNLFIGEDIIKIELFEAVNDMNLKELTLSGNIRVCLPIILSFSSLTVLTLTDVCGSPSPTKPFSFFQLFNLQSLGLYNCTSHGSSFPELPLNLEELDVDNHASLEQLSSLRHLNLEGCNYLKELPDSIGHLTGLYHLNLNDCVKLKRLPKPITQLTTLSCLNMSGWSNLKQLPEQLGELKGLKRLNASCTAIEQLPDSIAHLKKLGYLDLRDCKNLTGVYSIEILMDYSFSDLLNLVHLNLRGCSELKRLPEQLGKMQCLEFLDASHTAIKELPDSIGSLPRIKVLGLAKCEKLTYVPNSIRNLKSIGSLYLSTCEDIVEIELIENVKDMNLQYLGLSCNIRLWLPIILSFSSLISLSLRDKCGSPSPTKPFSFFQLSNLTFFTLTNSTTHGSSFPELPLNLRSLQVESHASLEQVPDLSYLKHLKDLYIVKCCSLQSLHKLPPHLSRLTVTGCTSLQDFPDVSMLRNLEQLEVTHNGSNLKLIRRDWGSTFGATLQNKEIAEWFDYKNRGGCTLSFHVPPNLGDHFVGVAFWVVYKCSYDGWSAVEAVITNKTEGMTTASHSKGINSGRKGDVLSFIHCIRAEDISMKSGDKIMISYPDGEVNMCGVHILK